MQFYSSGTNIHVSRHFTCQQNDVSRKFVYQQVAKATQAIDKAFQPVPKDEEVLFHLPVTKQWIRQFVLAQVLYGHSSFRAVLEIFNNLFDYHDLSLGSIYNIIQEAIIRARNLNDIIDISRIRVGAHDEIYQAGKSVLVEMDVVSTYCYLRAVENHYDETSWGIHLLDLNNQGLLLDYTIADGGLALRYIFQNLFISCINGPQRLLGAFSHILVPARQQKIGQRPE